MGRIQASTWGLLFLPEGLSLKIFSFSRTTDIYFIATLFCTAFPGWGMELLTLPVPYAENCCQVWIKCFMWRFELLLISHKGRFYGIILVGTNNIFIFDSKCFVNVPFLLSTFQRPLSPLHLWSLTRSCIFTPSTLPKLLSFNINGKPLNNCF